MIRDLCALLSLPAVRAVAHTAASLFAVIAFSGAVLLWLVAL
jgi:hypothetical protein